MWVSLQHGRQVGSASFAPGYGGGGGKGTHLDARKGGVVHDIAVQQQQQQQQKLRGGSKKVPGAQRNKGAKYDGLDLESTRPRKSIAAMWVRLQHGREWLTNKAMVRKPQQKGAAVEAKLLRKETDKNGDGHVIGSPSTSMPAKGKGTHLDVRKGGVVDDVAVQQEQKQQKQKQQHRGAAGGAMKVPGAQRNKGTRYAGLDPEAKQLQKRLTAMRKHQVGTSDDPARPFRCLVPGCTFTTTRRRCAETVP
jgi:hypothetical protein